MIHSKRLAIERAVDFILVLEVDFLNELSFHELIAALCALFPRFILTSPRCLESRIEHQKLGSVLRTGHRRNQCGLQSILLPCVFISVD